MINSVLVGYVLRAAVRDRVIVACLGLTALCVCLSVFLGSAAIVEKGQFAAVYTAGGVRFISVFAMMLFVTFYMQRSFANRDIEFLLSRPITRVSFILSHAAAFALIAAVIALISGSAVAVLSYKSVSWFYALWTFSLFCEIAIISFAALFFSMVLESATTSMLVVAAFYALARVIGQILGVVTENSIMWASRILEPITKLISVLIPRFDLMTQSSWLIYGPQGMEGVLFICAQSGVFALLVLSAAVFDLTRRQF